MGITVMHSRQVIHGAERGEPSALLLSPSRASCTTQSSPDLTQNGSQFTFFLTAPLQAFCELVGLTASDRDKDVYEEAENIIRNAFAKWEVMLCSSTKLDLVWAQVLPDPLLRRLILRFIFYRGVVSFLHSSEARDPYMPECSRLSLNSCHPVQNPSNSMFLGWLTTSKSCTSSTTDEDNKPIINQVL